MVSSNDVRSARLAASLTQAQAAAIVGLRRWQTWQEWELGVSPPDPERYRLFCHLTGLSRIPFGTIRPKDKSSAREAAELQGKIDEMLAGNPGRREAQR